MSEFELYLRLGYQLVMPTDWHITLDRNDITLWIAILGAALGILNFAKDWWRNRVRLKVVPTFLTRHFLDGKSDPAMFFENRAGKKIPRVWGVEITNKGVAVKIREVGFKIRHSTERAALYKQYEPCSVPLPHLLERNDSVTIYADLVDGASGFAHLGEFKAAYARTTSGHQFSGTTRALKQVAKKCLQ